jgi:hypothetical protein
MLIFLFRYVRNFDSSSRSFLLRLLSTFFKNSDTTLDMTNHEQPKTNQFCEPHPVTRAARKLGLLSQDGSTSALSATLNVGKMAFRSGCQRE